MEARDTVHSQGYGISQLVDGKEMSITSVASPVNLWWRTGHSRTARCTLLAGHKVQLLTHELTKARMNGKDKVTVVVTILSEQSAQ